MFASRDRTTRSLARTVACATLLVGSVQAQATFSEDFDDVGGGLAALQAQGWTFDSPATGGQYSFGMIWVDGSAIVPPFQGVGHLFAGISIAPPGEVANWIVLPPVPNQVAGDVLRFRCYVPALQDPGTFEVRYSAGGGSGTGGGNPAALGDFGTVLATLPATGNGQWFTVSVVVPGPGRIAMREHFHHPSGFQSNVSAWIDDLAFNPPISGPPFPAPGETVHWTTAMSPIVLSGSPTIVAGGTVLVDAGVTVQVQAGSQLVVGGVFDAQGTAVQKVSLRTTAGQPGKLVIAHGGYVELLHADVQLWVEPLPGDVFDSPAGDLTARQSRFTGEGRILANGYVAGKSSVLVVEDCAFEATTAFWHQSCQARLRNVSIAGGDVGLLLGGHVNLEHVSANGASVWLLDNAYGGQATFLDHLTIANNPQRSGLLLDARNFLLGANVSIQNTDAPVEFGESGATGLLPGSHVPATGNVNNIVLDTDRDFPTAVMGAVWAPLDVPYVIPGGALRGTGDIDILPGARIVLGQGVVWELFGRFNAEGAPGAPIVFENSSPALRWNKISSRTGHARFDHCIVRGADFAGLSVTGGFARISNMRIEDCFHGLFTQNDGTFWEVTKSRFQDNFRALTGPLWADGGSTPNSIAGNTEGAWSASAQHAEGNWWGSPTGPTAASNPGGTGDKVTSASVDYQPFATVAPDFDDVTPTVRLVDTRHRVYEPGAKVIVHWTVEDDSAVVQQRVLFSPSDFAGTHVLLATLPADRRSYEWTVPAIGLNQGVTPTLRIEAIDDAGQVGWDEQVCAIPLENQAGLVTSTTDLSAPQEFRDGFQTTWSSSGWNPADPPQVYARLSFEGDFTWQDLGGAYVGLGGLGWYQFFGNVSSDFVRLHLAASRGLNRTKHFFSQPFTLRPDARMGDAPPAITLLSPSAASYAGGSLVSIAWTASDDEGLRSFDIIASYDGGRWYYPIVRDLPAAATSWNWQLPPSTGIADVRVRVFAKDHRFQNSSDESAPFAITPDGTGGCGVATYCTGKTSSSNCQPSLVAAGPPSLAAAALFVVSAQSVESGQNGIHFFGTTGAVSTPFQGGFLCVQSPVHRLPLKNSGGAGACGGVLAYSLADVLAQPSGGPLVGPGTTVYQQCWFRDPNAATTTGLSNAMSYVVCP
jgi:hypothetical protein